MTETQRCTCGRTPQQVRMSHSETCALVVEQQEKALRERDPHPDCTRERECPVHPLGHGNGETAVGQ